MLDKILTELEKLPAEQAEVKTVLIELIKSMNTEKGTALSDLSTIKSKNVELSNAVNNLGKTQVNYDTMLGAFKKIGIDIKDAKDADEFAKLLNIEKSESDKITSLETIIGEKEISIKDKDAKLRGYEVKEKVQPKFDTAVKEFKDKDGNAYALQPLFVDKHAKALFEDPKLDFDSEPLLNDAITKALQQVHTDQVAFVKATGATFNPDMVHDVNIDGNKHHQQGAGPDLTAQSKNITDSKGSLDSCIKYMDAVTENIDNQNQ